MATLLRSLLTIACLFAAGILATNARAVEPINPDEPVKKVLFIGIDGCRFDAIHAAKTTHLARLIAEGAWANNTLILGSRPTRSDTISGPGWSSLLTGVWADKHGVNDNEFKDHRLRDFPDFFTRLKSQQPGAICASLADWVPIHTYIVTGAEIRETPVRPGLSGDKRLEQDYERADVVTAELAAKILRERNPTATFVYFGQVDETGHKHGFHPSVPQYIQAIRTVDELVGKVLGAIEARQSGDGAREDWLILVSSDHGGKGTNHGGGHSEPEILNSFLIVHGSPARPGKIEAQSYLVDVPVTALTHLGVKIDAGWQLDGKPVGLKD